MNESSLDPIWKLVIVTWHQKCNAFPLAFTIEIIYYLNIYQLIVWHGLLLTSYTFEEVKCGDILSLHSKSSSYREAKMYLKSPLFVEQSSIWLFESLPLTFNSIIFGWIYFNLINAIMKIKNCIFAYPILGTATKIRMKRNINKSNISIRKHPLNGGVLYAMSLLAFMLWMRMFMECIKSVCRRLSLDKTKLKQKKSINTRKPKAL